jgi:hypothetical protein
VVRYMAVLSVCAYFNNIYCPVVGYDTMKSFKWLQVFWRNKLFSCIHMDKSIVTKCDNTDSY